MPTKPKKPCGVHGCPNLVSAGTRFCPKHAKEHNKEYERHRRDPDTAKRYDSRWRKISAAFIKANPLCEICEENGRLTPAVLVHHKRKLTDGGTSELDNLQALCDSCHSRLHTRQGDNF